MYFYDVIAIDSQLLLTNAMPCISIMLFGNRLIIKLSFFHYFIQLFHKSSTLVTLLISLSLKLCYTFNAFVVLCHKLGTVHNCHRIHSIAKQNICHFWTERFLTILIKFSVFTLFIVLSLTFLDQLLDYSSIYCNQETTA